MFSYYPQGSEPYSSAPLGQSTQTYPVIDGVRKRTAVVAEATAGTTPASPGFMLLRDIAVDSAVTRQDERSPERRFNAPETGMVNGLSVFEKTIRVPWARDAATDVLLASAFGANFSSNTLNNGRTQPTFTLEETYAAEPSPVHRRLTGCVVDEVIVSLVTGEPGLVRFRVQGLSELATYDPAAGATYADPTPNYAPVTAADITVENLFSLTSPRIERVAFGIRNNVTPNYRWGSREPFGFSMGGVQLVGQAVLQLTNLGEYTRFASRQSGLGMSLLIGSEAGARDRLEMLNVDVYSPDIDDPGTQNVHRLTLNFMARISADSGALISLTRNV